MRTKQVNTSLLSLSKWKKKESNILQLIITGSYNKVKRFWKFIKVTSCYRWTKNFRLLFDKLNQKEDLHVVMQLEGTLHSKLYQKESVVQIQTEDGKNIEFPLLNTQIVEMLNGMVYIQGKSYDIFANPIHDRRNEIEVVPCTVVDVEEERLRWN